MGNLDAGSMSCAQRKGCDAGHAQQLLRRFAPRNENERELPHARIRTYAERQHVTPANAVVFFPPLSADYSSFPF
jgi:hypothetical protein